jgi:3-phytase
MKWRRFHTESLSVKKIVALLLLASLSACTPTGSPQVADIVTVQERYLTVPEPRMNIDSVASYRKEDGTAWLFATAKEGQLVRIYDAANGRHIRDFGAPGAAPGQFSRPNGIVAIDGMLVVVERDNRRVQIFSLPELLPLAAFGSAELLRPYGAYVLARGQGSYDLFVTDAYETADERVPPAAELDRRVQVFSLAVERGADGAVEAVAAAHQRSFGATSGPGVLRVVESIWGDPDNDRLMIAEEDPDGGRVIKVYDLAGSFSGALVGERIFQVQPEGIALFECADGSGYWVTTDQGKGRNVFHLFERVSLAHAGAFQGARTLNTDGIWLASEALPSFPGGAFFAVHDDQAVAAFDWRDIANALNLPPNCANP